MISALASLSGEEYYIFLNHSSTPPRTILRFRNGSLDKIQYSGGPATIKKARILNGTIFAIDGTTNDRIYISKDQGNSWTVRDVTGITSDVFTHMQVCGDRLFLTKGLLATDPSAYTPGYFTDSSADTFTEWRGVGPSLESIPGALACSNDRLIAAIDFTPYVISAPASDPTNWTSAGTYNPSREPLAMAATETTIMIAHDGDPQRGLGYSTDGGSTFNANGNLPVAEDYLSSTNGEGPLAAFNQFYLATVDQTGKRCYFYRFSTGSENPASLQPASVDCGPYSDVAITSIVAGPSGIIAAYKANSDSATGLLYSTDGANFRALDLSDVWNGPGHISSIQRVR